MYRKLPGGNFRVLKKAWLDFVHEQKEKDGGQRYLPKAKRCHCGKSLTSYPHWHIWYASFYFSFPFSFGFLFIVYSCHQNDWSLCWLPVSFVIANHSSGSSRRLLPSNTHKNIAIISSSSMWQSGEQRRDCPSDLHPIFCCCFSSSWLLPLLFLFFLVNHIPSSSSLLPCHLTLKHLARLLDGFTAIGMIASLSSTPVVSLIPP